MKALLWKELRENGKWAILAMLSMGTALCYALYANPSGMAGYYDYDREGITLCRNSFLLVTTFGSAAIGVLLGFLQIAPELKRDRWAALLHRPASRSTIFWGKVLAGVALYAFATLPAFAFAVWQVATPGNFGVPFLPAMIAPGLADIAAGLVYYFAALATALHRGGWVGVRLFPLLAALHASFLTTSSTFVREALFASALTALVLVVAAWGAMAHPSAFGSRSWPARIAFLAVLYFGVLGLGGLARSFLTAAWPAPHTKKIEYEFTNDGFPIRLTSEDGIVTEAVSLDGKPLTDAKFQTDRVRNQVKYLTQICSFVGDSHGWKPWHFPQKYRNSDRYLRAAGSYQYPRFEQWFHIQDERYFVSYEPLTRKAVDRLDERGFQPLTEAPRPLPEAINIDYASQESLVLWDETSLRFIHLPERKIVVANLPRPGPIFGIGQANAQDGSRSVNMTAVALGEGLAMLDKDDRPVTFLPYQRDVNRWGNIRVGFSPKLDRYYLWHQPSAWIDPTTRQRMSSYLDELDANGQLVRTFEMPPLPTFPRSPSLATILDRRLRSPAFFFGEMLYRKIGGALGSEKLKNALAGQLGNSWKATREIAIGSGAVSLVLAIITLAWARHAQLSWKRAGCWAGFVLLFNLAGFIAFWLTADWPPLVACPACGKKRPTETDICPACRGEWPANGSTGTEIFDNSSEVTA